MNLHHFSHDEFRCACGQCDKGFADMQRDFLRRLDRSRGTAGIPFRLTSSIRCADHNRAVGGVEDSAHLTGWAADVAAASSRQRYLIVLGALNAGITRIGVAETFVHLDADPDKAQQVLWTYE